MIYVTPSYALLAKNISASGGQVLEHVVLHVSVVFVHVHCVRVPMFFRKTAGLMWILYTMQAIARPMYSNPPLHGALIVKEILGDQGLKQQFVSAFPFDASRQSNINLSLHIYANNFLHHAS